MFILLLLASRSKIIQKFAQNSPKGLKFYNFSRVYCPHCVNSLEFRNFVYDFTARPVPLPFLCKIVPNELHKHKRSLSRKITFSRRSLTLDYYRLCIFVLKSAILYNCTCWALNFRSTSLLRNKRLMLTNVWWNNIILAKQ